MWVLLIFLSLGTVTNTPIYINSYPTLQECEEAAFEETYDEYLCINDKRAMLSSALDHA